MAGRGVPQDYHEAIRWLTKAAEQNHRNAKVRIAECYQALGNLVEAFKWLMLASDQDNLWKEDLNSLRPLLTKEQIAEAEKRYRQFQSSKK
jgi:tetratricopeptide (TPR) repeat protein